MWPRMWFVCSGLCLFAAPCAAQSAGDCRVIGQIRNDLDRPVEGALVSARGPDGNLAGQTLSNEDGSFSLPVSDCRTVAVRISVLGYEPYEATIEFDGPAATRTLAVRLEAAPLTLPELRVHVERSELLTRAGFYRRKAWIESTGQDYGQFMEHDEVQERAWTYPILRVIRTARMSRMYPTHPLCRSPSFYVDGKRVRRRYGLARWINLGVPVEGVVGLEIYRPLSAAIPDEYREENSNTCGAVLIWTDEAGSDVPQVEVTLCEPRPGGDGGVVEGVVIEERTAVPLPAATVSLTLEAGQTGARRLTTRTDENGRFRFCGSVDPPASVRATYAGSESGVQLLAAGGSDAADLILTIRLSEPR